MIDQLEALDLALFRALNDWHHPFWDAIMWQVSNKWFWVPGYAVLLWLMYRKVGLKHTLWALGCIALLITLADQTASGLLKPLIGRFRPCRPEASLEFAVHIVNNKCGGAYGFVSSHAANFFALASFLSGFFQRRSLEVLFFCLAALVAYSRIYLGVHYPGDVLGGALLGLIAGEITWFVYQKGLGWFSLSPSRADGSKGNP